MNRRNKINGTGEGENDIEPEELTMGQKLAMKHYLRAPEKKKMHHLLHCLARGSSRSSLGARTVKRALPTTTAAAGSAAGSYGWSSNASGDAEIDDAGLKMAARIMARRPS